MGQRRGNHRGPLPRAAVRRGKSFDRRNSGTSEGDEGGYGSNGSGDADDEGDAADGDEDDDDDDDQPKPVPTDQLAAESGVRAWSSPAVMTGRR
jgi:hypothetical protein